MSKSYTQKTAALKATTIDTKILDAKTILISETKNGAEKVDILDLIENSGTYYDLRGKNITENDIWGHRIERNKGEIYFMDEWLKATFPDDIKESVAKVYENKAYDENDNFILNIETQSIKDGSELFSSSLESFDGPLTNLEIAKSMFASTALKTFYTDLPSLIEGESMFEDSLISEFSANLDSLIYAKSMFKNTKNLSEFRVNLPHLLIAESMFEDSSVKTFSSHVNLYNGINMFRNSEITEVNCSFSNLLDGTGMFENTNLSLNSIRVIAETLPSINAYNLAEDETKNYVWANGLNWKINTKEWSEERKNTIIAASSLDISPDTIGEIMITWKDPSDLNDEERAIIIREYFKLMTIKGWTVITNITESGETPDITYERTINDITYKAPVIHYPAIGFTKRFWEESAIELI